ncbi:MAG: DUF5679 domain-containing protein [Nitrosopumilus sp.]|nr:DUF5679 domain-containing protein [Nitrosopumilus sp.]
MKSTKKITKKQSKKVKPQVDTFEVRKKIIPRIKKQNKKLDSLEKKLHSSTIQDNVLTNNSPEAYCVKCKTKRKINTPRETIMKNGRAATTGFCSECGCKVFRIGKMKK